MLSVKVYEGGHEGTEHDITNGVMGTPDISYEIEESNYRFFQISGYTIKLDTTQIEYEPVKNDYLLIFNGENIENSGVIAGITSLYNSQIVTVDIVNEFQPMKPKQMVGIGEDGIVFPNNIKQRVEEYTDIDSVQALTTGANAAIIAPIFAAWTYPEENRTQADLIYDISVALHANYNAYLFIKNRIMYVGTLSATSNISADKIKQLKVNTTETQLSVINMSNQNSFYRKSSGSLFITPTAPYYNYAYSTINELEAELDLPIGYNVYFEDTFYGAIIGKDFLKSIKKYKLQKIVRYE